MSKDAYYFSHDSNAKDDYKCTLLIEQLGLEGYGIFWVLVETLRDQPDYKYPLKLIPSLARKFNTTTQKVETVVKGYELFEFTEDEFFYSNSLMNRMGKMEELRLKRSNAGKKGNTIRWNKPKIIAELSQGDCKTSQKKLKETKLKESKVNIKEEKIPYQENVLLTETNYNKLIEEFGKELTDDNIEKASGWKSNSANYKKKPNENDYLRVKWFIKKDLTQNNNGIVKKKTKPYDFENN